VFDEPVILIMDPDPSSPFIDTARFHPLALIGRGGMGVVYRVCDEEMGADVALKTIERFDADELYRLKQEFRVLAGITHPNLVELYELVVAAKSCFFTMELVEGKTFFDHVRAGTPDDRALLKRVTEAARQLVEGLAVVHAANRLHRDIKPSNVLVTREGRVVILDFGLATIFGSPGLGNRTTGVVVGTISYMAPEQAEGRPLTPAADWYSVGVMLYEALTGHLPFEGPAMRVLDQKLRSEPEPPRTHRPTLPAELDALVTALLQRDPAGRPTANLILERLLLLNPEATSGFQRITSAVADTPFVGRESELKTLTASFEQVQSGQPVVVHVVGPSGIGKTEFLRRFLASLAGDPRTVVLAGRCHPQEAVPYKALDGLVDALTRFLMPLPEPRVSALIPRHPGALMRLFPVLGRIALFADWRRRDEGTEPAEIRRRGFGAFRDLFARIADRYALVLWIDDAQWSDVDSAALLGELLRPPDPPVVLLIVSYRSEDQETIPLLSQLSSIASDAQFLSQVIVLGPLDRSETRELARRLSASSPEAYLEAVTDESRGSPFFVAQMIRHLETTSTDPTVDARTIRHDLATMLDQRVSQLPEPARNVLEVVAAAGRPLDRGIALEAARLAERSRPVVQRLEQEHLLRTTQRNGQTAIEVYHDRIREAVLSALDSNVLRGRHADIAAALENAPDADPEELLLHHREAGHTERAGHYATIAADRALGTLAFDRAAHLYRQGLALGAPGSSGILKKKLGEALANAGRGTEAGEALEDAAAELSQVGAAEEDVSALHCRAADQFLRSGDLTRGLELIRKLLAQLDIPLPSTRGGALRAALWQRARFLLRPSRFSLRSVPGVEARRFLRLDTMWAAANGLSLVDPILSDGVGVRCLNEALEAGELHRIIRALGAEAAREAALGGILFGPRSQRMLRRLEALAANSTNPYDQAWVHQAHGTVAYMTGRWRIALEHHDAASEIMRVQCKGVAWELATLESFAVSALGQLGEIATLAERLPAAIADADRRGDVYASTGLRSGVPSLLWLAHDQPVELLRVIDEWVGRWPRDQFLLQHYLHLNTTVQTHLYRGDPAAAWKLLLDTWPRLRGIYAFTLPITRVELYHLRARAALALATRLADANSPESVSGEWSRERLLRQATADARSLEREHFPSARLFALLLRAGIAYQQGLVSQSVDAVHAALTAARNCEMGLHAATARYCMSQLSRRDSEGDARADSERWMRAQGISRPAAIAAMLAPGLASEHPGAPTG
jgi:predicted Ser/Thr protein kinase